MRGADRSVRQGIAALALVPVALAGCGGGEEGQSTPGEKAGTYPVEVVRASFPTSQRLAENTTLTIAVRNAGDRAMPNVAVTIEGNDPKNPAQPFAEASAQPGLADRSRPIWVVDNGPRGGVTAYTNTWSSGRLAPGRTRTFRWRVTAVRRGTHTIRYRVNAGLGGKAKAELAGGRVPEGRFTVNISQAPAQTKVAPDGSVVVAE